MSGKSVFFKIRLVEATVSLGEPAIPTALKESLFAVIEGQRILYSESVSVPSSFSGSGT